MKSTSANRSMSNFETLAMSAAQVNTLSVLGGTGGKKDSQSGSASSTERPPLV